MPDDMRTTGGPGGTMGVTDTMQGPSTSSSLVPDPSAAGEGPAEGDVGQAEKGNGGQHEDEVCFLVSRGSDPSNYKKYVLFLLHSFNNISLISGFYYGSVVYQFSCSTLWIFR